jgi:hypothetical protein
MNRARRTISLLVLLSCAFVATATASDQDAARHPINRPDDEKSSPAVARTQDGLKSTQDLMTKIRATADPVEKRKLLSQHLQSMRANLELMRALTKGQMTRQGVDMMQAMLDQMAEHQKMEEDAGNWK